MATFEGEAEKIAESLEEATAKLEIEKKLLEIRKALSNESKTALDYEFERQELGVKEQRLAQENEEALARTLQTELEILKAQVEQAEARGVDVDALRESVKQREKEVTKSLHLAAALRDGADQAERRAKALGTTIGHADNLFKRITPFLSQEPETAFASFILDPATFSKKFSESVKEFATPMSLVTGLLDIAAMETAKLAIEQDGAVVNFRKATGASGEFDDNIRGLERSLFTAGVGAAEAGQAVQTLFLNVTDFTEMSEKQQETLGETVAVLNELGVASETTAKNIQFATKVMGLGTNQAEALQRELFTFAKDLGVSGKMIAEDFASMGPQIAALGSNGVDAFRKLEVQAKNTGLQLSEILGIVEKFDKFDSAAQSVGKLNALLGGPYLNTLELVAETDPSKRFEILKDRIDDAGMSFDSMDYYQKKAMASAMGLNEQQLALMMRGRLDLIKEPAKSAADIEALAEQTAQFNTVMEELMQIGKGLAVSFGPVISGLKWFLQKLQIVTKFLWIIVPSLLLLGGQLAAMTWNMTLAAIATQRKVTALVELVHASFVAAEATQAVTIAERSATVATWSLTTAFYTLILPIGLAIGLYLTLTELFGYTEEYAGLAAIGLGLLAAGLWAVFAAESAVLFGIPLIIAGLSSLAGGIYAGWSPSILDALDALVFAIYKVAPAIIFITPFLFPLATGLSAVAVAALGLSYAFSTMINDSVVTNLQLMSVEIANVIDKINELSALKAAAFTATMAATTVASAAVALAPTGALAAAAAVGGGTAAAGAPGAAGAPAAAAAAAPAAAAPAFTGPPPTINVNLSIDGKEFATVVNSVDVSKYTSGKKSTLYDSVVRMIEQGLTTGKA